MSYQIRINNFEGPFDLLFHLIEKAEVDIYDIPIAQITNQYLEYIYEMENLDLETASEFIVMAATLIQIKSKLLLPKESNPFDEIAADGIDPRAELVERLLEYKQFKEAANLFKEKEEKYFDMFYKNAEIIDDIEEESILLNITLQDIVNAFDDIIKRYQDSHHENPALSQQISRDEFTVDEKIDSIRENITKNRNISFHDLFSHSVSKIEMIITFLALLELIRLKEIRVYQSNVYGDIIIQGV